MPYIGQSPSTGQFIELDALTASATDTYTLQLNSANFAPESVNNLIVSINGVVQKPSSMSLNGSSLTVGATLSSSDTIDYVRVLGHVGSVVTPTDGSVTSAKLDTNIAISGNLDVGTIRATNGTSAMSIDSSGRITQPNLPIFFAERTSPHNSSTSFTEVVYNLAHINRGNAFNTSTGRYTAPVTGVYQVSWNDIGDTVDTVYRSRLYVNGSATSIGGATKEFERRMEQSGSQHPSSATQTVYIELTAGQYISIFEKRDSGSNSNFANSTSVFMYFCGHLIG